MRTLSARVLLCTALARFSAGATFPDPGTSWPEAEETLVEGLEGAKGFVEYGSVPFLLFSDLFPEVATSENASQNAGVWTSKRTQAKLAALSVAVNAKWVDATLLVVRAWMPPRNDSSGNCGQNEERPTYYNEGRAVGTCIRFLNKHVSSSDINHRIGCIRICVLFPKRGLRFVHMTCKLKTSSREDTSGLALVCHDEMMLITLHSHFFFTVTITLDALFEHTILQHTRQMSNLCVTARWKPM